MSKLKALLTLAAVIGSMPNIAAPAYYGKDKQRKEQVKALEKKQRVREQIRARRAQKGR